MILLTILIFVSVLSDCLTTELNTTLLQLQMNQDFYHHEIVLQRQFSESLSKIDQKEYDMDQNISRYMACPQLS